MNDKNALTIGMFLFAVLFALFVAISWAGTFHIIHINSWNPALVILFKKIYTKGLFVRLMYCLVLAGAIFTAPNYRMNLEDKPESRFWIHLAALVLSILLILGFKFSYLYGLFVYPVVFITHLPIMFKSINDLRDGLKIENKGGLSCLPENDMSFEFMTDQGLMRIHSPQQGIFVEGGAGSGKSASVIEPLLYQACQKGFAGVVYDFKGNPPTLSRTVYRALKKTKSPVQFAMINFTDLTQSVRVNPLSPKYLINDLYATEAANIVMLALNKSWIEKRDFWADNAISILDATIKMFKKNHPDKCTLPHVISAILTDYEQLLTWLATDPEIEKNMLPVMVAHKKNAAGQTAGAISSVQLPLNKLYTKEVFWVLAPPVEEEFNLDITNKNNPTMFCIANNPALTEALSPAISLIISTCMQQMNQQGKNKSIFCVDELPTIYINKLDVLPATARSNKVITALSVQSYAQLERDYSKQNAEVIVGNLANQFIGMTNENRTAQRIVDLFGEIKYHDTSISESESGGSQSFSIKKEKRFQLQDVMGQKPGHFMGKIAGGEPPLYSVQLPQFTALDKIQDNIPPFALDKLPIQSDEATMRLVFSKLVDENFKRINREVAEILEPFKIDLNKEE